MSERRKPGVAFWATVMVVVATLYVASEGPAIWLYWKMLPSRQWDRPIVVALEVIYAPADWAFSLAPESVRQARSRYLMWGTSLPPY